MHCTACNVELTDFEATRQDTSGEYVNLCNECFRFIQDDVDSTVRFDLMNEADVNYSDDYDNYGLHELGINIELDNDEDTF